MFKIWGEGHVAFMLDRMGTNLKEGNIKFVILMDSMDERLKDLIIYVNQNSQFDIYAVQLEYYKFQEYEIMIPKLFGVEVKKNIKTASSSVRFVWTKEKLMEDIKLNVKDENIRNAMLELYVFSNENADEVGMGSGKSGSFTFKFKDARSKSGVVSLFTVYSDGNESCLQLTFENIVKRLGEEHTKLYFEKLAKLDFMKEWNREELLKGYSPSIYIKEAFKDKSQVKLFEGAIKDYLKLAKG